MKATEETCNFTIDQQWRIFLERAGFEPGQLPQLQEEELQKAFYAACGQLLFMMRDEMSNLTEEQSNLTLTKIVGEISLFWKKKTEEYEQRISKSSEQQGKEPDSETTA